MTPDDESIETPPSRDLVGSLEKGLGVLEILAAHPRGMTLTEMADAAGLTRAGARRLLLTLVASGYARQDGRAFRLSPRLLALARTWVGNASLWSFAEPFMREVSQALNESCSAAVLSDQDVVYVARVGSTRILSVALHVGTRLPAWCTSMGRVLAAGLPDAGIEAFVARADLQKLTPKSTVDRAADGGGAHRGLFRGAVSAGHAKRTGRPVRRSISRNAPVRERMPDTGVRRPADRG